MRPPWLTVVTAVYNDREPLLRTLDSVASQTGPGVEHLIVDGGSSDGSLEAAHQSPYNPRILSGPDRGVYDAMNRGWQAAHGRLVVFLNAGDTFLTPGTAESLREVAGDADWIRSGVVPVDSRGQRARTAVAATFDPWAFRLGKLRVLHQGTLMTRSLLADLNGFDLTYAIAADFDLMIRALDAGYAPRVVDINSTAMTAGGMSTLRWRQSLAEKRAIALHGQPWRSRIRIRGAHTWHYGTIGTRRLLRRGGETLLGERAENVIAAVRQ